MDPEAVRMRLLSLIDAVEEARRAPPTDLLRAALNLEHAVLSDLLSPEEEAAMVEDSRLAGRLAGCQGVFCELESAIERNVGDLLRLDGPGAVWGEKNLSQHYIARYELLARGEIALGQIGAKDRVLFIGSGPLPITAFEYVWQVGCAVDCLDYLPEAIREARATSDRLGLDGRVRFHQTRGEHHDPSSYDVVLVGVLAEPKEEILRRLDREARPDCRILLRTTHGLRQLIYRRARYEEAALTRIRFRERTVARGDQVISADLLVVDRR